MISLKNISYNYKNSNFGINNLSLDIENSKITMIIGKNGSGKSTLANIIANIVQVKTGEIKVDEIDFSKKNRELIRNKIGIVFQDPNNQIIFNKVYDDIKFTLTNYKVNKDEIESRIRESLQKVGMLDYIDENPYQLSSGQKQRIVLASVLAINPDYIVFDESTAFLDSEGKSAFYDIIRNLASEGKGIIFISNDLNEMIFADKVIVLDEGKVCKVIPNYKIVDNFNVFIKMGFEIPLCFELIKYFNIDLTKKNYTTKEIMEIIKHDNKN